MARRAETNIADCNTLRLARKSKCASELAGKAITGTSGHYLAASHFGFLTRDADIPSTVH